MTRRPPGGGERGPEFDLGSAEARVIPFRRKAQTPRRRRRSTWLRLLAPIGAALLAVAAPAGAVVWVLRSQRFALREIDVREIGAVAARRSPAPMAPLAPLAPAAGAVTTEWVRAALEPLAGRNLPALDLAEVQALLRGHPWIGAVEARKELPRRLHVEFVERVPEALLETGQALFYVDGRGAVIAPAGVTAGAGTSAEDPAGVADLFFVRVSSALGDDLQDSAARALAMARELEAADGAWYRGLSEVEVLNDDDCRVVTSALPFPILVRRGNVALGAQRLRGLLPEIRRRYERLEAVDLRSSRRVVLQPADLSSDSKVPAA